MIKNFFGSLFVCCDAYSVKPANLKLELANIVASGVITTTLGDALNEIVPQI